MSDVSANLSLPYIQASQAQKHVTHNEGMRLLDALTQLSVGSASETTPPGGAVSAGARYIVAAGATGAWAGQDGQIALFENGGWAFLAPATGWLAYVEDTASLLAHDGTTWTEVSAGAGSGGLEVGDLQNLPGVGVGTTSDTTNLLAVRAAATLLTHDGAGHQIKVNKNAGGDTASLLFQTDWQGRAEMGTTGSDSFEIKTSADGVNFNTALIADAATGEVSFPSGVAGLSSGSGGVTPPAEFGTGPIPTLSYLAATSDTLIANGGGHLGNSYGFPAEIAFDGLESPGVPGSFVFTGHGGTSRHMTQYIPVSMNRVYELSVCLKQEDMPGDWSAYVNDQRHRHVMGLTFYDADLNEIAYEHVSRYWHNGTDSRTVLSAPLSPGDTVVEVADATGWNEAETRTDERGILIYGYRNAAGRRYDYYSRIYGHDLFDLTGVDKTANQITLKAPLPASMGNPDDPSGTWPAGTPLANTDRPPSTRNIYMNNFRPDAVGQWYRVTNYIGGEDRSGKVDLNNFNPGTAFVRPYLDLNNSNRAGGFGNHPDTGTAQRVWVADLTMAARPWTYVEREATGSVLFQIPKGTKNGTIRNSVPNQVIESL